MVRVQKSAVKLIMGSVKSDYNESLEFLNIPSLKERREQLCLTFARQAIFNKKSRIFFPKRKEFCEIKRRWTEKFQAQKAKT